MATQVPAETALEDEAEEDHAEDGEERRKHEKVFVVVEINSEDVRARNAGDAKDAARKLFPVDLEGENHGAECK